MTRLFAFASALLLGFVLAAPDADAETGNRRQQAAAAPPTYALQLVERARVALTGRPRDAVLAARLLSEAVGAGEPEAMLALGALYGRGEDGVPRDLAEAERLLNLAIEMGRVADGWMALGQVYAGLEPPDLPKSAAAYQKAAQAGAAGALEGVAAALLAGATEQARRAAFRDLRRFVAANDQAGAWMAIAGHYANAGPAFAPAGGRAEALSEAARLGNASAGVAYARMLARGDGVAKDFARAVAFLEEMAAARPESSTFEALGEIYQTAGEPMRDPAKAIAAFRRAGELGSPWAKIKLARMIGRGDGAPVDMAAAEAILREAIAGGAVGDAWHAMGEMYRTADADHRDLAKAAAAYEKGVEAGYASSMIALARMAARGEGVPANFVRAGELAQAAINAGAGADGWQALADLYRNANPPHRDLELAVEAYQKAVDLGSPWAMLALAQMQARGEGAPADFDKAIETLRAAIAAGAPGDGWNAIGDLYRTSPAPHRNPQRAVAAYGEAAKLGDPWAMMRLARMYAEGEGVDSDRNRARDYLEQAVAAGAGADAWQALGDLYRTAPPPFHDLAKAIDAYQRAAGLGSPWAMMRLARSYEAGEGLPRDLAKSREEIEKAIAAGAGADGWLALGAHYRGIDETRDLGKAVEAYEKAAALGSPWGMLSLARMVENGEGVAADRGRARSLIEAAIAAGEPAEGWHALAGFLERLDPPDTRGMVEALARGAAAGNPWSMLRLARLHARGEGVAADFEAARRYVLSAIHAGAGADGWTTLGDLYRAPGPDRDMAAAADAYQRAVDLGSPWAMLALSQLALAGDGVEADRGRARALIDKAILANAGGDGWQALGDFYFSADPPDLEPAIEAFKKAADLGNPSAMMRLARLRAEGRGFDKDVPAARALIEKAIAAGAGADGWTSLGASYENAEPRDPEKAVAAYETAVGLGDPWAMASLARLVMAGEALPADPARARSLLEGAVAGGNEEEGVFRMLGDLYAATGEAADARRAAAAYERAAAMGSIAAKAGLARIIARNPRPNEADFKKAAALANEAVAAGDESVFGALGDLYSNAPGSLRDTARAAEAYRRAVEKGEAAAMIALAGIEAENGRADEARKLLDQAIGAGAGREAWNALGELLAPADPRGALAAFEEAARLGNVASMLSAGEILLSLGVSGDADFTRAEALLKGATGGGDARAAWRLLGDLYDARDGREADAAGAWRKAADLGEPGAMLALGKMLLAGDGAVAADPAAAAGMLDRAVRAGLVADAGELLGDLHAGDPAPEGQQAALRYYELAAEAGSGPAHIGAARLLSVNFRDEAARGGAIRHLRSASAILGSEPVARAMLNLQPQPLQAIVQALLVEAGQNPGQPDGVFGQRTMAALEAFCAAEQIAPCDSFITTGLIEALLPAEPPAGESAGEGASPARPAQAG